MDHNKKGHLYFCLILILASFCVVQGREAKGVKVLSGPYLGQKPPGMTPEIFVPGIVSTEKNEVSSAFHPNGKEFYFGVFNPSVGYEIHIMKEVDGRWTKPELAPFSGKYSEVDVFITGSGSQFFFISKRPVTPGGNRSRGYQIWFMSRKQNGWGEPVYLGPDVNFGSRQLYPTVSENGTLYFNSNIQGYGKGDFYCSRITGGKYGQPENLGNMINTKYDETDLLIAPDENYVIFTASGRPDSSGSGDLYISFRTPAGGWEIPKNMGKKINSPSSEFCPMLTHDGKYFFFTSDRRGNNDIYWMNAAIINTYKTN